MARTRSIRPGFFTNDALGGMRPVVRLLFAGLWTIADREGRLEDRPVKIQAAVLPYDRIDVDRALTELASAGFLRRYKVGEGQYIQISTWTKHQRPHPREEASMIPAEGATGDNLGTPPGSTKANPEAGPGGVPEAGPRHDPEPDLGPAFDGFQGSGGGAGESSLARDRGGHAQGAPVGARARANGTFEMEQAGPRHDPGPPRTSSSSSSSSSRNSLRENPPTPLREGGDEDFPSETTKTTITRPKRTKPPATASAEPACCPNFARTGEHWEFCPNAKAVEAKA